MKKQLSGLVWLLFPVCAIAQPKNTPPLTQVKNIAHTDVKDQSQTGTCWSFSTTSLLEAQSIHDDGTSYDLSEMFTVRNIYIEKARNYVLRQGKAQFGPGGLGHDVIHAVDEYGAVPEGVYSGLLLGEKSHDHDKLDRLLRTYLDSVLKSRPIAANWQKRYTAILDEHLGKIPDTFVYKEKTYTPKTFAKEVLHFSADDYVNLTSYTHHPFYKSFILEAPDNFSNGAYYNVPLDELMALTTRALEKGYTIMWDADVSNPMFRQRDGYAMQWPDEGSIPGAVDPEAAELKATPAIRQALYENLTSQDDHLMHMIGLEKTKSGKKFFRVKNSWGEVGPFKGYINVSEAYFAINTVSLVIPKAALDDTLKQKLNLQ